MNSLMNYGSDDNSDDSGEEKLPEMSGRSKSHHNPPAHEDNYEEVGMDMSEDSNDEQKQSQSRRKSLSPKYRSVDRRNGRNDDREERPSRRYDDDDRDRRDNKGRDKYRDDRRDRYGRDRRRNKSRDRRRSPKRSSRSPKKSRSRSRDRGSRGSVSRREKADKRMDRLGKLGIEFKPDSYPASALEDAEINSNNDAKGSFMPGVTGRFRDQIEKRKLLWQKAKEPETAAPISTHSIASTSGVTSSSSKSSKVYEATTFADDKTSNKFKRLMGIKGTNTGNLPVKGTDVLKKQQEMFTSMEAQYEVARTATHTMRGVGLGFGSLQR